jgi:hypothetical protein
MKNVTCSRIHRSRTGVKASLKPTESRVTGVWLIPPFNPIFSWLWLSHKRSMNSAFDLRIVAIRISRLTG